MVEDDFQLKSFSEAVKARGIDLEPWKLEAFAEKKELGQSEAEIIRQARGRTDAFKSQHPAKRLLAGTVIGAVGAPVLDWAKSGGSSRAEAGKRSLKMAASGAVVGAVFGWAASLMQDRAASGALENRWAEFKNNTHEMEIAWTEALAKQAAEKEPSVPKNGPVR